ncbi:hypothetical protein GQ53DRAFT_67479 [Thozetella sp. PMI_491]|nr:hypothetical protein GQ53DRAFT_67479 [Thozetella sp. PMI_491]
MRNSRPCAANRMSFSIQTQHRCLSHVPASSSLRRESQPPYKSKASCLHRCSRGIPAFLETGDPPATTLPSLPLSLPRYCRPFQETRPLASKGRAWFSRIQNSYGTIARRGRGGSRGGSMRPWTAPPVFLERSSRTGDIRLPADLCEGDGLAARLGGLASRPHQ